MKNINMKQNKLVGYSGQCPLQNNFPNILICVIDHYVNKLQYTIQ